MDKSAIATKKQANNNPTFTKLKAKPNSSPIRLIKFIIYFLRAEFTQYMESFHSCFIQNNIITIQLGNKDFQIVWDCITTNISLLKDILEDEDTITVWWNSIFDLLFLYKNNIFPRNIYDGILAEQLLYN